MHKTKFGISVGLTGAIACTFALVLGLEWYVLAIFGYLFLTEENPWLKKFLTKILVIIISVWLIDNSFDLLSKFFDLLNSIFDFDTPLKYPWSLDEKIINGVIIVKNFILIVMAISAFSQKNVKLKCVDKIVDKNT